ncbi:MAG TPA: scyllo-inosose 3-dehydrogenase [Terriglobales bacterium]|nr:scyllo-inosose 3-dehydrogenase [Terriglobales bacterium]
MKAAVISAEWAPRADYPVTAEENRTHMARIGSSCWKNPTSTVTTLPDPTPGPEDVILKVAAAGLCGSDLHFFETDAEGYMHYPGMVRFPSVPGHEVSGEVVAVGSRVKYLKPGDLVCLDDMVCCHRCEACRRGFPNQCENLDDVGFTMNGGCAELLQVPESNCWNINALVERFGSKARTLEAGAVIEPFTVGYNALFECAARIKPGAYATVYGAGSIGLAVIQLLRATGATQVLCFEKNAGRRELATKVGAHAVYDGDNAARIVMEATGGAGADVQVECAGAFNAALPQMEACAANGSQIVVIGRDSKRVPVFLENFQCKKANIVGAMGNTGYGTYPNVLRMMAAGLLDPTLFITDRFPLDHFNAAVEKAKTRAGGKVLVQVNR